MSSFRSVCSAIIGILYLQLQVLAQDIPIAITGAFQEYVEPFFTPLVERLPPLIRPDC